MGMVVLVLLYAGGGACHCCRANSTYVLSLCFRVDSLLVYLPSTSRVRAGLAEPRGVVVGPRPYSLCPPGGTSLPADAGTRLLLCTIIWCLTLHNSFDFLFCCTNREIEVSDTLLPATSQSGGVRSSGGRRYDEGGMGAEVTVGRRFTLKEGWGPSYL